MCEKKAKTGATESYTRGGGGGLLSLSLSLSLSLFSAFLSHPYREIPFLVSQRGAVRARVEVGKGGGASEEHKEREREGKRALVFARPNRAKEKPSSRIEAKELSFSPQLASCPLCLAHLFGQRQRTVEALANDL